MLENNILSNSIDSIIATPPFDTSFVNSNWSNESINSDIWKDCLRVLKPGGYIMMFGGTKSYYRIACVLEDIGFEIRDCIMWMYNSDKDNIKPDFEPIIVARKSFEGSLVDNVIENNIGAMNIDDCRIDCEERTMPINSNDVKKDDSIFTELHKNVQRERVATNLGRFPSNTILTYTDKDKDIICKDMPYTKSSGGSGEASMKNTFKNTYNGGWGHNKECSNLGGLGDEGSAGRYFYNAVWSNEDIEGDRPLKLYQYLIRLVNPKNSNILYVGNSKSIKCAVGLENAEYESNYKCMEVDI